MRRNYGYFKPGWPGLLSEIAGGASPAIRAFTLLAGGLPEEWILTTPASPSPLTDYKFILDGGIARVTTDGIVTQNDVVVSLYNAILKNPIISSRVLASISGTEIVITARSLGQTYLASVEGPGLTAAKTSATGMIPQSIPFGRFVARSSTSLDLKSCCLPSLSTDILLGVSLAVRDLERNAVGQSAVSAYKASDICDIVVDTQSAGIWVETVDESISINDSLY
ncbi:MAG: hypothetical protein ACRCT1_09720, partial [Microcoleaceae cyanobacterium]